MGTDSNLPYFSTAMRLLLPLITTILLLHSCKKESMNPPDISLKTSAGYTYHDTVVAPGTILLVGVIGTKTDDPLKLIYNEVAYDGANVASLVERIYANDNEKETFIHDFSITTRSAVGTERWIFNVNDKDGRLAKKEIRITVQ
ncbi:MAG: hypothetical protein Fur0041_01550 [Bacteroidia bacterium]